MRKHIFIHIAKTGGTSIRYALRKSIRDNNLTKLSSHRTVREWIEILGEEEYFGHFSFAVVRNPWDRMVSMYSKRRHLIRKMLSLPETLEKEQERFNDWLKMIHSDVINGRIQDRHVRYYTNQYDSLATPDDSLGVSFVGRYEQLEEDWQHICKSVGIVGDLKWLSKSLRMDYFKYYTPESAGIVGELFGKDVDFFGYRFKEEAVRNKGYAHDLQQAKKVLDRNKKAKLRHKKLIQERRQKCMKKSKGKA